MVKLIVKIFIGLVICTTNLSAFEQLDLSTLTLKNPNQPLDNIITGGQPSMSDINFLKQSGVKNIINLRSSGEHSNFDESEETAKKGLSYFSLEIGGADDISVENAIKLDNILKSVEGISFLHCASSNRVGALLAIREVVVNGKTKEEALTLGKKAGLGSLLKKTETVLNNL